MPNTAKLEATKMERNTWYDLDPDNRKDDPKQGLFCIRCKRKLKDTQCFESFISVKTHPKWPYWVMIDPLGKHLIGIECVKTLDKVGLLRSPEIGH